MTTMTVMIVNQGILITPNVMQVNDIFYTLHHHYLLLTISKSGQSIIARLFLSRTVAIFFISSSVSSDNVICKIRASASSVVNLNW